MTVHGSGHVRIPGLDIDLPHPWFIGHFTERDSHYHSDQMQMPMPGRAVVTVTLDGGGVFWDAGRRVEMRPGMAFVSLLKEPRTAWGLDRAVSPHWRFLGVIIGGTAGYAQARGLIRSHGRVFTIAPAAPEVQALLSLVTRPYRDVELDPAVGMSLVNNLFACLMQRAQGDTITAPLDLARRAERRLRDGLADPPPLASLARQLGVSREHLSRIFCRTYGCPPQTYVRQLRISQAQRLLHTHDGDIAATAKALGWSGTPAFHRAFVRLTGCTPAQWRRR